MFNPVALFSIMMTISTLLLLHSHSLNVRKEGLPANMADTRKRPFCNAFTGCGRKRSNLPALTNYRNEPAVEESIDTLLELSAEPAVEDISRQIMSEAKLWEAIQEANIELSRAKQESVDSLANDGRGAASGTCTVPHCYI